MSSKKHRAWDRELKAEWVRLGRPQYCEIRFEGCMGAFGLALCHSMKRRFIQTKEQYWEVVAGCVKCHQTLDEKMSHEEMKTTVNKIREER